MDKETFHNYKKKLTEIFSNCHYEFILKTLNDDTNAENFINYIKPLIYSRKLNDMVCINVEHNLERIVYDSEKQPWENGNRRKPNNKYLSYDELKYVVDKLWKSYYRPLIISQIRINISFDDNKTFTTMSPLKKIGVFRHEMKGRYSFTDINYVKLVYNNKILDDDNLNFLDINYNKVDEEGNDNYIYVMINDPNEPLIQLDEEESVEEAPSPEPEETINSANVIQAEPINSTSNEISILKDRITRLENTLESIIQHLDSTYESS